MRARDKVRRGPATPAITGKRELLAGAAYPMSHCSLGRNTPWTESCKRLAPSAATQHTCCLCRQSPVGLNVGRIVVILAHCHPRLQSGRTGCGGSTSNWRHGPYDGWETRTLRTPGPCRAARAGRPEASLRSGSVRRWAAGTGVLWPTPISYGRRWVTNVTRNNVTEVCCHEQCAAYKSEPAMGPPQSLERSELLRRAVGPGAVADGRVRGPSGA